MKKLGLLLGAAMILGTTTFAGDSDTKACCKGKKEACSKEKVEACEKGKGCCKKGDEAKVSSATKTTDKSTNQSTIGNSKVQVQPAAKKSMAVK